MKLDRIYSLINNKGILKEVSFEFNPGNLYYIIVENENVGDSLFDVIGLVSPIMEGSFIINDLDVSGLSYKEKAKIRRENIGFIFKNILLDNHFTVFENVLLPLINNKDLSLKEKEAQVNKYLKKYNLENLKDNYPDSLSLYEKQVVSLARSLVNNPKFILTYEPTILFNDNDEKKYYDYLKALTKLDIGVIIITRKIKFKDYANKIYWYENNFM